MEELTAFLKENSHLSPTELNAYLTLFTVKTLQKGDYFAKSGEFSTKFGFLTHGVMRGFYRDANGKEFNKSFFTTNRFVGALSALLTQEKNQINIQCIEPCELLVADYQKMTELFVIHPGIERLAKQLTEQAFIRKEKREIQFVMMDAAERYQIFLKENPQLAKNIPQYHIASYLGITPTQLSRIRNKK